MPTIAGLRGTGDWGADERPKNFRETILRRNPNGTAPILALSSRAGKRTTDDPEFAWWDEANDIIRLQVNGALAAGDTTVIVDSDDPSAATPTANYGSAFNLKPGDVLLVEPATDNATFNHELMEVESVQSATQFTVKRGAGGTTAGAVADNVFLTLIGSAYAEGTSAPLATARNPHKFFNFTQIFKDTYELTGTADATRTRTGNNWSEDKKRKLWKHAADMELAFMFGRRHEGSGSNGKPKRYMGGLREFIPASNTTVFGAAVTANNFLDAVSPVFDWDTGAGDTRAMFMGNGAAVELGKVMQNVTGVRFDYDKTVDVYGINFVEFITPRGRLFVKIHPLLSRHSLYNYSSFVIDFDALKYVAMKGRDTKPRDDVQAKDEDVRRGFVQTEASIEVDYAGLTMAYLGNIRSA